MDKKITKSVFTGVIAIAIMTLFMIISAALGMPKMSPPEMLAVMMGIPLAAGWLFHFIIGIIYAGMYTYLFSVLLRKVISPVFRGIIFGVIAFLIAQAALAIMSGIFGEMESQAENMTMIMMGSVAGHIVFGISVVLIAGRQVSFSNEQKSKGNN